VRIPGVDEADLWMSADDIEEAIKAAMRVRGRMVLASTTAANDPKA
jgi:hypothetical protein